ncbi:uncharacterized protein LOC132202188 [Neocloeon triangulifer]|uniref:uncharacterized protein LOC132202188 n=1 Tax=Neocloeon triangulifer TaxID=2078957 RepID=UPI00286F0F70|nr:uncharacterized protein LOC132202188 [Neocloeon triangulifer]
MERPTRDEDKPMKPVRDFAAPPRFLGPPIKAGDPIPSPAPQHAYERMLAEQNRVSEPESLISPGPEEESKADLRGGADVCGRAPMLPLGAGGPAPPTKETFQAVQHVVCSLKQVPEPVKLPLGAGGPGPRRQAPPLPLVKDDKTS